MDATGRGRVKTTIAYLRRKIVSGEWPVGSKIPTEPELMEMLGVGRTTVREAVRSLATLGLLEPAVSRGTFVRSRLPTSDMLADFVSEFPVHEILGFRRALEIEACQLAARNRTEAHIEALRAAHERDLAGDAGTPMRWERGRTPGQFHQLLIEATGNSLMVGLYAGVMAGLRTAINKGEVVYGAGVETRRADHAAILEAIIAGDPIAAVHAAADHAEHDLIAAPADDDSGDETIAVATGATTV
ncbi:FadR/GntR family transcriptional regulator [Microbacterium sp. No. 7]|uniref:FadR/GntR family transcriptional regulator n=1 Tax=Microbacterium sp. No. 7 TaxID=1714373 RepID=UPI0006D1F56D|nr:GntR family transcriptional regulator [Microbacterium sp. No. 7]